MAAEPETELRERAIARLKKKNEFAHDLLAYVLVNGLLVVIWALTGHGFFWPAFPLAGWGLGLIFHAWDTFGSAGFSEERIHWEMEHLQ